MAQAQSICNFVDVVEPADNQIDLQDGHLVEPELAQSVILVVRMNAGEALPEGEFGEEYGSYLGELPGTLQLRLCGGSGRVHGGRCMRGPGADTRLTICRLRQGVRFAQCE